MSAPHGFWYANCSECGYEVNGVQGIDSAHCSNPSHRHVVRRPQRGFSRTPEASEIYHALNFRTYSEYRRSKGATAQYQRYVSRGQAASTPKHANERYLETLNKIDKINHWLSQAESNLTQFFSNVHRDQRFYFDRKGRELQERLLEYTDVLRFFFTEDLQANLWRATMHERYQLEDEWDYAMRIAVQFEGFKKQNFLKWNEMTELENIFRGLDHTIQARIGDYTYRGIKERIFQEGCVRIDQFANEVLAFLREVYGHIRDGGAGDYKWFQDPRSRKIFFNSTEREYPQESARRPSKSDIPVDSNAPEAATPRKPRRLSLFGPGSNIDTRNDLAFRRNFSQSSPRAQNIGRKKHITWQDLPGDKGTKQDITRESDDWFGPL